MPTIKIRSQRATRKQSRPQSHRKLTTLLGLAALVAGAAAVMFFTRSVTTTSFDIRNKAVDSSTERTSEKVKVVVIQYLPEDAVKPGYVDAAVVGDSLANTALTTVRSKLATLTAEALSALTDSSRYHAYSNPNAMPYLTYVQAGSVIEYTEALPIQSASLRWNTSAHRPNYQVILTRENICDLVDNQGVRQVWLWGYHHGNVEPAESNMAMGQRSKAFWNHGTYGDVSNSEQSDDMPICNNTYVLFNYNMTRGLGETLENHTHHLEQLYNYLQDKNPTATKTGGSLFWNKFVGSETKHSKLTRPVCGWTHLPPNTAGTSDPDYSWYSTREVSSDCMDWKPDGSGKKTLISCATWAGPGCPNDTGVSFKKWWMQSLPGYNNGLSYMGYSLRNWWEPVADFDRVLAEGGGLFSELQKTIDNPLDYSLTKQFYNQLTGSVPAETDATFLANVALVRQNNCKSAVKTIMKLPAAVNRKATYSNEEYVKMLYRALHSRDFDQAGLNAWVTELQNNRYTRDSLIEVMYSFPELKSVCTSKKLYLEPTDADHLFTQQLYLEMTGSVPAITDNMYLSNVALVKQNQCKSVALALAKSPAGSARINSLSSSEYVKMLYRALHSRDFDQAGLNAWVTELQNNRYTRDSLIEVMYSFPELKSVCTSKKMYTSAVAPR